ncbi:MAG TPA: ATP-dependent DNA helicase RecG, partial [Acidimicrobiia bacterium]|nr:ATP-dependent DNA helicase RecG [Acidimicrobiia bacterium]
MATLSRLAELPTSEVRTLGRERSRILEKAGIKTVADLLHHVPRTYIDRSTMASLAEIPLGSEVTVVGEVKSVKTRRPRRNLVLVEAQIADDSASIKVVWFNQGFREKQLPAGTQVALSGTVELFRGALQMANPAVDVLNDEREALDTGRIVPIYPQVGDVKTGHFRRAIHSALARSRPMPDPIPDVLLAKHGLTSREESFADIHFPESMDQVGHARRRLVFDELYRLEVALALRKRRQIQDSTGIAHEPTGELVDRFLKGLPFELTDAQQDVLEEISVDLRLGHPMHRLLQGEVGSGKTVVAVATLLQGVEGGWQGAIMAPTEVLAGQHYQSVTALLAEAGLSPDPLGSLSDLGMVSLFASGGPAVHMALLTGSTAVANYRDDITRERLLEDVASGQVDILVGTHALIQQGVHFARLGVAVVDEQHRFGVAQRVLLKEKADAVDPDLLIMTATPIPRTLSMTIYGDLDMSMIRELPPGRSPVGTKVISPLHEEVAWDTIRKAVAEGRQAFVVCPLVEDSPKVEAASAVAEHARLSKLLPELRVGLIHGQLRSAEKDQVMGEFRSGEIDVLVATTVIEVGIDVPNATVMVIEDADRFGLSQLHQLRGRVGRGVHPGVCLLLADPTTEEGERRLAAMAATTDGFVLAEEDLKIRGQGTVFGARQSGMVDLRFADVIKDFELLVAARHDAFELVDRDPELGDHPELAQEVRAMLGDAVDW